MNQAHPLMSTNKTQRDSNEAPSLGANIKRLRGIRGWNLNKLAAESGLPQSTLSKVENGRMSLNYDKLALVARVLDFEISELFATPSDVANRLKPLARRTIQSADEGAYRVHEHLEFRYLCTELKNRLMVPILLRLDGRSDTAERGQELSVGLTHIIGERFAYVLSGEVEFHSEQYETTILKKGDALYIDAAMPHAFYAPVGQSAEILAVVTTDDQEYLSFMRRAASEDRADATHAYEAFKEQFGS